MKPHLTVTIAVYGLKIVGLAPFSYQIMTLRRNSGTTWTVRGFRFSKIGTAYNVLLLILIQAITAFEFIIHGPADIMVEDPIVSLCLFTEFIFSLFTTSVIIISETLGHGKAVCFMNRLVRVDSLLSSIESEPVSNKMIFVSFSIHLIFSLLLWAVHYSTVLLTAPQFLSWILRVLLDFVNYWFIVEYFVVLEILGREISRANKNLLKVKELTNNSSSSLLSNNFLPGLRFPAKTHLDDAKLLLDIRTTLYELSRDAEEFFSIPILTSVACIFFRLIVNLYYFIDFLIDTNGRSRILEMFIVVSALITITYPITLLSLSVKNLMKEAKLTGSIIHKLLAAPKMREMKVELRRFSLQLLHERVSFTGCDLFALDATILHSMMGATVVYLMVFF